MSFVEDVVELVGGSRNPLVDSEPSWVRRPLGSMATVINGFAFKSQGFNEETGHPIIRIRDVVRGITNTRYVGEVPDGYWVEDGDLLVGMDGDFNLGRWRGGRALLNQRVCKVVADPTKLLPEFLFYVLPGYLKLINDHTSSTTVKHLSSRTLQAIPVPVPPLDTQWKIVGYIDELFSELDDGETALARARADLETYRKSLLKAAVTGELTADWRAANPPAKTGEQLLQRILADRKGRWEADPKNKGKRYKEPRDPQVESPPDLPEGWTWSSLEQLSSPEQSSISDGPFGSNLKSEHYQSFGPRVVRLQNIGQAGNFVDAKAHISAEHYATLQRHHVKGGDLVVAILGEPLPRAVILPQDFGDGLVKADCIKVRIPVEDLTHLAWAWLNNPLAHAFVAHSVKGVGRPRIGMDQIKGMPIPLPGREELGALLLALSDGLEELKQSTQRLDAFSNASRTLRQSILAAAFRGELVQ